MWSSMLVQKITLFSEILRILGRFLVDFESILMNYGVKFGFFKFLDSWIFLNFLNCMCKHMSRTTNQATKGAAPILSSRVLAI